jgi:hypothetical protein
VKLKKLMNNKNLNLKANRNELCISDSAKSFVPVWPPKHESHGSINVLVFFLLDLMLGSFLQEA